MFCILLFVQLHDLLHSFDGRFSFIRKFYAASLKKRRYFTIFFYKFRKLFSCKFHLFRALFCLFNLHKTIYNILLQGVIHIFHAVFHIRFFFLFQHLALFYPDFYILCNAVFTHAVSPVQNLHNFSFAAFYPFFPVQLRIQQFFSENTPPFS